MTDAIETAMKKLDEFYKGLSAEEQEAIRPLLAAGIWGADEVAGFAQVDYAKYVGPSMDIFGFNPQPDPPGSRVGFNPQPDPPERPRTAR